MIQEIAEWPVAQNEKKPVGANSWWETSKIIFVLTANHLFSQTMKLLLISALLTASPWLLSPDIPWSPSKSGHGVKVYTRPVAGTPIKEIKAELELDCSINTAIACLTDIPSYNQWIYQMTEARVIKTISNTEFQVYQRVKTPWPLDDRDVIGHYVLKQDPRSLDVSIITHSVPKILPVVSGVVRVQKNRTTWTIKPLAKNKNKCEYFLLLDPAGEVPAWIINLFISEGPYSSLVKLKQRVHLPKYANTKFAWITEKFQ
ncbi:MAG: hypothetical protein RL285_84 [Bacteroidota bacterium]|jgi:hypothetical protein